MKVVLKKIKSGLRRMAANSLVVFLVGILAMASCSRNDKAKTEPQEDIQERIAAEVARQVAEQLAAAKPADRGDRAGGRRARNVRQHGEDAPDWQIGGGGPNGGLVYYAQDEEFYEATAPAHTVGGNDALPAGWVTPDMEDLGLIYEGLQKSGVADYGNVYYTSVSKAGGKTRFFNLSNGAEATDVTGGRKLGVRKFDPSQPSVEIAADALVYTPVAAPAQTASAEKPAAPVAAKYAIGVAGPGGGIVYSNSDGKYKEITKPENAVFIGYEPPSGWTIPSMPELMLVYNALHSKVDFGDDWYISSSSLGYKQKSPVYTRDHASLLRGQSDYDRTLEMFPNASFILAGGGPGSVHMIRFTDGKITLVTEDWVYEYDETGNQKSYGFYEIKAGVDPASSKYPDDYNLRVIKFLYVREWSE